MASQGGPPPPPPMMMHTGRIPTYKNTHGENFQNRCGAEPPACVQNAMMTKDKKPFTYTPGGLDLSQIKTPSMARRLNRQQQQMEDQSNPAYFQRTNLNGGSMPPPPPPPPMAPPPPPPLVINVSKSPKPISEGERPEIVIPENPIGMLRKTNSPYQWETELSERLRQGPMPKFIEKSSTPSPIAPQLRSTPRQFSQKPPETYENHIQQNQNQSPTSPIWKPEPKYPTPQQSPAPSPQVQQAHTPTKDSLQRQDSQFNHSPSPWPRDSISNSPSTDIQHSLRSITPASNPPSPWVHEVANSPIRNSPYQMPSPNQVDIRGNSPQVKSPMSPIHVEIRGNSPQVKNAISPLARAQPQSPMYNNANREAPQKNERVVPLREEVQPQQIYNNVNRASSERQVSPPWRQDNRAAPIREEVHPEYSECVSDDGDSEVRYQTHMTIPVTPRKTRNMSDTNIPNQVSSPRTAETPKEDLPWVRGDVLNKSAVPPPWCQRSDSRSLDQTDNGTPVQPPWCQKPQDTSDNQIQARIIPIQMEVSKTEVIQNNQGRVNPQEHAMRVQPQLRIIIGMNQEKPSEAPTAHIYQPNQQIRVIQPKIIRMDENVSQISNNTPQTNQPRTRIIPIQMEPSSPGVSSPRILQQQRSLEFPPRQSKAFRVLQVITGTNEADLIGNMEEVHGYTDL